MYSFQLLSASRRFELFLIDSLCAAAVRYF
jgi:hypothetical protein